MESLQNLFNPLFVFPHLFYLCCILVYCDFKFISISSLLTLGEPPALPNPLSTKSLNVSLTQVKTKILSIFHLPLTTIVYEFFFHYPYYKKKVPIALEGWRKDFGDPGVPAQ